MFKFKPKEQNYLNKLLHNLFIQKNIVLISGDKGTSLAALDNNKIIDTRFIEQDEQQFWPKCQQFFGKYKSYSILILLDNNDCNIKKELIPILQSVVKVDPVQQFVDNHVNSEDIYAYNVYNISSINGEVWNTVICTLSSNSPSFKLMEDIIGNNFYFGGVYFLNLEYQSIIQNILNKTNNLKFNNYLQIFSTITDSGGIKFVVKHKNEIIAIKNVCYPADKSEIYVQGMIEQQITDYLIAFKSYVSRFELRVCLIFLVGDSLKSLLSQSNFAEHEIIILTAPDVIIPVSKKTFKFLDNALIEIFVESKKFVGSNKSISSIVQLNLLHRIAFKPFILLLTLLLGSLLNIKYNIWQNQNNTLDLNTKYFEISNQYSNLKQRYPNISDITNLADLYSLETFLKIPPIIPFEMLGYIIKNSSDDTKIDKIDFSMLNVNNVIANSNINFKIGMRFLKNNDDLTDARHIDAYIKKLQLNFADFTFDYAPASNVLDNSESNFIPVIINSKKK